MCRRDFILIMFILAFAGGCVSIRGAEHGSSPDFMNKTTTIAVMPFRPAPDVRDSGRIVADMLANQLHALDHYNVVAPEVIEKGLADNEGETLSTAQAGKIAGAPYILTGSVAEYTYKSGVGETPVVGVTARLIQASNGEILWSATRTGTGGGNWFQEESLARLTALVCKDIANKLDIFLQKYSSSGIDGQNSAPDARNGR